MLQVSSNSENSINKLDLTPKLDFLKLFVQKDLTQFPKNKLSQVISYSVTLLEDRDYYMGLLIPFIIDKDHNSWSFATSIIYSLSALYTIYDLTHMLQKTLRNKKPCCHIFVGEAVTQLAALCSTVRSTEIIIQNENISNPLKIAIIDIFNNHNLDEHVLNSQMDILTDSTKGELQKTLIYQDLREKKKQLILISLQICLLITNQQMDTKRVEELSQLIFSVFLGNATPQVLTRIVQITRDTCFQQNIVEYLRYLL